MALKLAYTAPSGVIAPDAYHKVMHYRMRDDGDVVAFTVASYLDQTSRDVGNEPLAMRGYNMPLDRAATANQFTQCYTWLKAQEGWEGAVDA